MTTTRHGVPRVEADAVSYRYPDGTTALQEVSVRVAP
ncbi:phosphonate ABC transporter ATP-binding protein, partial [Rhodococcus sp. WS4]